MRKIFVAHPTDYDYRNTIYKFILDSEISKRYQIILPHEEDEVLIETKSIIQGCDYVIADISSRSTGVGIELGWANAFGKNITCVHAMWVPIHAYMKQITKTFIPFDSFDDLIEKLEEKFLFKWDKAGLMNEDLCHNGEVVGVLDKNTGDAQRIVETLSYEIGVFCDWHYVAGRAVVKTQPEYAVLANKVLVDILMKEGFKCGK